MSEEVKEFSDEQREKLAGVFAEMVEKATDDEEYRKLCLEDVSAAFKEVTGVELPETVNVQFVEGDEEVAEDVVAVPLPKEEADGELSMDDLESVAGGAQMPFVGKEEIANLFKGRGPGPSMTLAYAVSPEDGLISKGFLD